jgi:predicted phosphodiesterase
MRYLIISDLHANLEGLQAVLAATEGDYSEIICCGDLVGYGPDPDPVTEWTRKNVKLVVRGNHDRVCSGVDSPDQFNESARQAAYWTRANLSGENIAYLRELPPGPLAVEDRFAILHGSPRDEDEYVTTAWEAEESFHVLDRPITFFGHTHLQGGFLRGSHGMARSLLLHVPKTKNRRVWQLQTGETYFLNPGSVGQPRDGDTRAAFVIYDTTGFIEFGRTPYDMQATIGKMRQARLPEFLSRRLTVGR